MSGTVLSSLHTSYKIGSRKNPVKHRVATISQLRTKSLNCAKAQVLKNQVTTEPSLREPADLRKVTRLVGSRGRGGRHITLQSLSSVLSP